jgi:hypothetical protein
LQQGFNVIQQSQYCKRKIMLFFCGCVLVSRLLSLVARLLSPIPCPLPASALSRLSAIDFRPRLRYSVQADFMRNFNEERRR